MRRRTLVVTGALALGLAVGPPADAGPRSYQNCTELNKDHKGGVALPGAKDKRANGGRAKHAPTYDRKLYEANKGKDRDKDGIACER